MHVCHALAIFVPFVLACSLNDDYFEPKLFDPAWLRVAISWGYLVGCKLGWNGGDNLQWLLYSGSSHQCGGIVQEVSFACSTPGFHSCWIQLCPPGSSFIKSQNQWAPTGPRFLWSFTLLGVQPPGNSLVNPPVKVSQNSDPLTELSSTPCI